MVAASERMVTSPVFEESSKIGCNVRIQPSSLLQFVPSWSLDLLYKDAKLARND